jgi:hypothetical protein
MVLKTGLIGAVRRVVVIIMYHHNKRNLRIQMYITSCIFFAQLSTLLAVR